MKANTLVAKIWSYCDTLRDDGVSYGDYLEQITYLLFLKMADELAKLPRPKRYDIPIEYNWESLLSKDISGLTIHYVKTLKKLAEAGGMLTKIFAGAQNKIHDPFKLKKLIELINEESWVSTSTDLKGDIYESLLQKNAESSGAGQYFTPRPIIQTMVECLQPKPLQTISDPSCGTGGFFLGALNYINNNYKLSKKEKDFLKFSTFHGWEIVPATARLCLMNLFLHGVGDLKTTPEIDVIDSLTALPNSQIDIVLANPPFGKSSSLTITNEEKYLKNDGFHYRADFWTTSSNKQLNFVQHIFSMLKVGGQAAIVIPDNVLFEGGAGEIVRKKLLEETDLHTILRLPTGIFYAHGVKANILFFEKKKKVKDFPTTKEVWFYDYRTNIHHTLKKNPLEYEDLEDFIKKYNAPNRGKRKQPSPNDGLSERWQVYRYDEITSRDKTNLDIFWLKDESLLDVDNLPDPDTILNEIIENLKAGLSSFEEISDILRDEDK